MLFIVIMCWCFWNYRSIIEVKIMVSLEIKFKGNRGIVFWVDLSKCLQDIVRTWCNWTNVSITGTVTHSTLCNTYTVATVFANMTQPQNLGIVASPTLHYGLPDLNWTPTVLRGCVCVHCKISITFIGRNSSYDKCDSVTARGMSHYNWLPCMYDPPWEHEAWTHPCHFYLCPSYHPFWGYNMLWFMLISWQKAPV